MQLRTRQVRTYTETVVAVVPGTDDARNSRVSLFWKDDTEASTGVVVWVNLIPAEARNVAARLLAAADRADAMTLRTKGENQ
jgi:hypothetical protein